MRTDNRVDFYKAQAADRRRGSAGVVSLAAVSRRERIDETWLWMIIAPYGWAEILIDLALLFMWFKPVFSCMMTRISFGVWLGNIEHYSVKAHELLFHRQGEKLSETFAR